MAYDEGAKISTGENLSRMGGGNLLSGSATLTQRLDYQIAQMEALLAKLKQAKDVLARNPDYEFLADSLRHL